MWSALRRVASGVAIGWICLAQPVLGDQRDPRLDGLFERLQATASEAEATQLEQRIWQIWLESEDADVARLMRRGITAMSHQRYSLALETFDRMVAAAPGFAEGWNKRATVYYLMGNYAASVRDIEQTLALEPRHFGALSGLGMIYDALEEPKAALRSYEGALGLNPHLDGTRQRVEELHEQLEGRRT